VKHGDTIMRREITVGGGHASGQMGWWHFGLGDQAQTEMRVTWPDGTSAAWQTLDADHFYIMDKTKSPATLWHPQSP
jgi:enediyne biosynthesis protein E4